MLNITHHAQTLGKTKANAQARKPLYRSSICNGTIDLIFVILVLGVPSAQTLSPANECLSWAIFRILF